MKSPVLSKKAHAIVIGGSITGLLAARVLLNHFEKVTPIERDHYPPEPDFRPGIPQSRQIHVMLLRGQHLLESFFPGLHQKLLSHGAIPHDYGCETYFYYGGGHRPRPAPVLQGWMCSRLLLEWQIRQELAAFPHLRILEGYEMVHLLFDEKTETVTGVQFRVRNHKIPEENPKESLSADLVIDASGSSSRTPLWLTDLGYEPPKDTEVKTFVGYATRFYQLPGPMDWNLIVIQSTGGSSRGGILMKVEADRGIVVLTGSHNDYPPTNDAGYIEFAKSLSDKTLYEAIKEATPISKIHGYRHTDNHIRHFEQLERFPEHFLVMGDAVCCFNPVYGQGMTVAALEAQLLDKTLRTWKGEKGFSLSFQRKLARAFAPSWQLATSADAPRPDQAKEKPVQKVSRWYTERVISLLPSDPNLLLTFLQVIHMLRPPTAFLHPKIVMKVLIYQFSRKKG